jgi:hypothetical protein
MHCAIAIGQEQQAHQAKQASKQLHQQTQLSNAVTSTSSKRVNSTKNQKFKITTKQKCLVKAKVKADAGNCKGDQTTLLYSGNKSKLKKSTNEWLYYIGLARQASDYKALTKYLI